MDIFKTGKDQVNIGLEMKRGRGFEAYANHIVPTSNCTTPSLTYTIITRHIHHTTNTHGFTKAPTQDIGWMGCMHAKGNQNKVTHMKSYALNSHINDKLDPHREGSKKGKIHSWGITNSPTLQEDLVPRSRTERTLGIQNGGDARIPK